MVISIRYVIDLIILKMQVISQSSTSPDIKIMVQFYEPRRITKMHNWGGHKATLALFHSDSIKAPHPLQRRKSNTTTALLPVMVDIVDIVELPYKVFKESLHAQQVELIIP